MPQDKQPSIDSLVESFSTIARLMKTCFHAMLAEETLSPSQVHILLVLKHDGPMTARQLADALFLSPGAVSQLIEPLVDAQLINRSSKPEDRRVVHLELSANGKKEVGRLESKRSKILADLAAPLSTDELQAMLSAQQRFIEGLRQYCKEYKEKRKDT